MPRITVTTDDGEVIQVWNREDIGDLSKFIARSSLTTDIIMAVMRTLDKEKKG